MSSGAQILGALDKDRGIDCRAAPSQSYGESRSRTPISQVGFSPLSQRSAESPFKVASEGEVRIDLRPFNVEAPETPERRPAGSLASPIAAATPTVVEGVPPPLTPQEVPTMPQEQFNLHEHHALKSHFYNMS